MRIQPAQQIAREYSLSTPNDEKRGFRQGAIERSEEVILSHKTYDQTQRVVVGYDRFGRIIYGTSHSTYAFDVRDSKERDSNISAPKQAHN